MGMESWKPHICLFIHFFPGVRKKQLKANRNQTNNLQLTGSFLASWKPWVRCSATQTNKILSPPLIHRGRFIPSQGSVEPEESEKEEKLLLLLQSASSGSLILCSCSFRPRRPSMFALVLAGIRSTRWFSRYARWKSAICSCQQRTPYPNWRSGEKQANNLPSYTLGNTLISPSRPAGRSRTVYIYLYIIKKKKPNYIAIH